MIEVNEKVQHIKFGMGVITEVKDRKIWVQFENELGTKIFLYPEGFEKFLKAQNPLVEKSVLEELHIRQEQLEMERKEKIRESAELQERKTRIGPLRKKSAANSMKRRS